MTHSPPGRFLVLTTDLPYFPGKMGLDFFNLRHLARHHVVGLVAPEYPHQPPQGLANLRNAVTDCFLWPHKPPDKPQPELFDWTPQQLRPWVRRCPQWIRRLAWRHLAGLLNHPESEAVLQIHILNNLAPQLLHALTSRNWQAVVVIQSSSAPWFSYLPRHLARICYFHDVRADYLEMRHQVSPSGKQSVYSRWLLKRQVARQEMQLLRHVDAAGFVSERDREEARRRWNPNIPCLVSPISVDMEYFHPAPRPGTPARAKNILFTGHLSHPPNVDAACHLLRDIWPLIRAECPDARLFLAGCHVAAEVADLATRTPGVTLLPDVPDVRPLFQQCHVFLVPMRFGGGVRQKIMEAWAMRVPVLCTSMAAMGAVARDGHNCLIRDVPAELAATASALLRGEIDAAPIVERAHQDVLQFHSAPVASAQFEKLVIAGRQKKKEARSIRILHDLHWMDIGKAGGIEPLAHHLISAIACEDSRNQYRLYGPGHTLAEWRFPRRFRHRCFDSSPEARHALGFRHGLQNAIAESLGYPILDPELLNLKRLAEMDFDLVHAHACYMHHNFHAAPHVVQFTDLQHWHHPEFFTVNEWAERDRLYHAAAVQARHLIAISEFTRQDLHRRWQIPLDKITTLWPGPTLPWQAATRPLFRAQQKRILQRLQLDQTPFFLFPAHPWPHKNHRFLLSSFEQALPDLPDDCILVMTGRPLPPDHEGAAEMAEAIARKRVRHLGYRTPLEMTALFSQALALVFPSLFEGFGLPLVDAFYAGCPVLSSDRAALPEVGGEAALYASPTDRTAWASGMARLAADPELRRACIAAGHARREQFTWRKTALQTIQLYEQVFHGLYE